MLTVLFLMCVIQCSWKGFLYFPFVDGLVGFWCWIHKSSKSVRVKIIVRTKLLTSTPTARRDITTPKVRDWKLNCVLLFELFALPCTTCRRFAQEGCIVKFLPVTAFLFRSGNSVHFWLVLLSQTALCQLDKLVLKYVCEG